MHRSRSPRSVATITAAVVFRLLAEASAAGASTAPTTSPAGQAAVTVYPGGSAGTTAEWSPDAVRLSPRGDRRFRGQFGNEKAALTLKNLPEHTFVRVRLELLVILSWDGNDLADGPDVWELAAVGGPTLVQTTFHCLPAGTQAYPDRFGFGSHPGRTGSTKIDDLGFLPGRPDTSTAMYRMVVLFPHTASSLELMFQARGLQPIPDETWALSNVQVDVFRAAPGAAVSEDALKRLWAQLLGEDPLKAHEALWALVGAGERAAALADRLLELGKPIAQKSIRQLIAELDDPQWAVREQAGKDLLARRPEADDALREASRTAESPEVRLRAGEILQARAAAAVTDPQVLRQGRIVHLLEVIGSQTARGALRRLAAGGANAQVRDYAQDVLNRRAKADAEARTGPGTR